MGSITITIPQNIQINYIIENTSLTKLLLEMLNTVMLRNVTVKPTEDRLLGLFTQEAPMIDQMTEQAMQSRETDLLRVH